VHVISDQGRSSSGTQGVQLGIVRGRFNLGTTLRLVGGQPREGLTAAWGLAADRANLVFNHYTPSGYPIKYGPGFYC
jgi:hypothetical protein